MRRSSGGFVFSRNVCVLILINLAITGSCWACSVQPSSVELERMVTSKMQSVRQKTLNASLANPYNNSRGYSNASMKNTAGNAGGGLSKQQMMMNLIRPMMQQKIQKQMQIEMQQEMRSRMQKSMR